MTPINNKLDEKNHLVLHYRDKNFKDMLSMEHFHNCYELAYFKEANLEVFIKDKKYSITSGDLIFINEYELHRTVMDEPLVIGEMELHHILPKSAGGNDRFNNLILLNKKVHQLIHVSKRETIEWLLESINLNDQQLGKINSYRKKVGNYVI